MTIYGSTAVKNTIGLTDKLQLEHQGVTPPQTRDGFRTVAVIVTSSTQSVTTINIWEGGVELGDGGFTAYGTHTAQGKKFSLFGKTCGPTESLRYVATISPAGLPLFGFLADFITDGDPIRTTGFADTGTVGTTLTLPSVTAADADDIYTVCWNAQTDTGPFDTRWGKLSPISPLVSGTSLLDGTLSWLADGDQSHQSSAATGTRLYATHPTTPVRTYDAAVGVIMLVGTPILVGGWGVGMVRMGGS